MTDIQPKNSPPVPQKAYGPDRGSLRGRSAASLSRPIPYGARTLAETDFIKLREYVLREMEYYDISKPKVMELHPSPGWQDPFYKHLADENKTSYDAIRQKKASEEDTLGHNAGTDSTGHEIIGNMEADPIKFLRSNIDGLFPNNHASKGFALTSNEFNALSALHELGHYYAEKITLPLPSNPEEVLNLHNQIEDDLNGASGQSREKFMQSLLEAEKKLESTTKQDTAHPGTGHGSKFSPGSDKRQDPKDAQEAKDRIGKYEYISASLPDRIADTTMVLYALSNYGNTQSTRATLMKWDKIRKAGFIDYKHETSSSIERAINIFAKDPRKRLSFYDSALWAKDIIENQPDLRGSPHEMAHEIEIRNALRSAVRKSVKDKSDIYTNTLAEAKTANVSLSDRDKQEIKKILSDATKARNDLNLLPTVP